MTDDCLQYEIVIYDVKCWVIEYTKGDHKEFHVSCLDGLGIGDSLQEAIGRLKWNSRLLWLRRKNHE